MTKAARTARHLGRGATGAQRVRNPPVNRAFVTRFGTVRAVPLIAGVLDLDVVMNRLRTSRPVFHSEADFQHAFGQVVHDLDPGLGVRLEVRQQGSEHLDLLCFGPAGRTAVEFKYVTAAWDGPDPRSGESFQLRAHAAHDLARRNFIFDVARLERFCSAATGTDGLALLLTNAPSLWAPPSSARITRDREFRIHEGRTLTGTLRWGGGDYPANERHLTGSYSLMWREYSHLPGRKGTFRWLAVRMPSS